MKQRFARAQDQSCARFIRLHKNKCIKKLLNRHGHRILWLPPYSSDLNPIEKKWAEVKTFRQGWGENNLNHLFSNVCCYKFKLDLTL
ncbi:transposase [Psychrobacter celer]|uniref:transposase n=1 Tax=Psychrobacter celer TaxID=306572 RepID=UPI003FCF6D9C